MSKIGTFKYKVGDRVVVDKNYERKAVTWDKGHWVDVPLAGLQGIIIKRDIDIRTGKNYHYLVRAKDFFLYFWTSEEDIQFLFNTLE